MVIINSEFAGLKSKIPLLKVEARPPAAPGAAGPGQGGASTPAQAAEPPPAPGAFGFV